MKKFEIIYHYVALIALLLLTACQSDETTEPSVGQLPDGKVRVHLKVGVAGSGTTRAWRDSENADTKEMMNVWTVVAVNATDNKVVSIYACKPNGEPDQEIDDYVELPSVGNYRFYSFANMSPKVVMTLLGIGGTGNPTPKARRRSAGTSYTDNPTGGTNGGDATGSVTSYVPAANLPEAETAAYAFFTDDNTYAQNKFYSIAFTDGATVTEDNANAKTINVAGNNFDVDANNAYGAKGIPMSNVQTISVSSETTKIELIVIRLIAKIELQIYNDGTEDLTINSISLTEITKNSNDNLKLLPNLTLGANTMEYKHKDIKPSLGSGAKTGNMTLYPTAEQGAISATGHKKDGGTPVTFTFYVNESAAPDNGSGLFYVTLGIKTGSGTDVVYSHALINQKGSTSSDDNAWDYIARNDYRQIPIVLTDWLFRIEPIAFVPIAGYPATLLSSDAQKATFSTGGIIALQPFVKKRTDAFWLDFSDPDVTFVDIHWKNSDGTDVSGAGKIVKTAFSYDDTNKCIIGEMNQARVSASHNTKTAITVTVKLGPSGSQFTYSFTCDVNI